MLTHKQIAKNIKAKGLQKLKFYCQMCEKQCRDENGFKNHCDSDGHIKQMEVFAGRSNYIVEQYSKEFEFEFIRLLSRRYPTVGVSANQVYNEFIKDRDHVHMNSTKWSSLSEFVMYLGKNSKCKVEDTPKGWFVQYIDRDPETAARHDKKQQQLKSEISQEDREKLEINKKINKLNQIYGNVEKQYKPSEISLENIGNLKVDLNLNSNNSNYVNNINIENKIYNNNNNNNIILKSNIFNNDDNDNDNSNISKNKKPTALDEIMQLEAKKDKIQFNIKQNQFNNKDNKSNKAEPVQEEEDNWIMEGIIVKIMDKELSNGKYYKQKAIIKSIQDKYVANLMILDTNTQLIIDQNYLETVIPSIGGTVLILKGSYKGTKAKLVDINVNNYSASLEISNNTIQLPYEHFSKI